MLRYLKFCLFLLPYFIFPQAFADSITLSGNPAAMTINTATAGQQPNSVTNTSTTYSVSTTTTVRIITGKINSNTPTGVSLKVGLAAPTGATSLGSVAMTTVARNLVTGIPLNTTATAKTVTYNISATVSAAKASNVTRTLTLTVQ